MQLTKKSSLVSLITLVLLILVISSIKLRNPQNNILSWDVFGAYLYLPATFIYDDPTIKDLSWVENINSTYNNTATLYQLSPTSEGRNIIRFSPGIAIMMSPFFMLGHGYATLTDNPADGFSDPYQNAIILAGLLYAIIGLIFLRKILLKYLNDRVTAITLAVLCISSNFFFFITLGNDVPHVYAFTLNILIIWLSIRWHEDHRKKYAILLGLILGLAVISRISEVLMVIVPVLWGVYNWDTFIKKLKLIFQYRTHILLLVLAGFIAVLPQLFYWNMASGGWLYWAYNDPGSSLDFYNPRFWWVLFSFRKGFFIYAPVMIFSIIGFYFLFRKKKEIFFPLLLISLFHIYLIACFSSLVAYGWRAFIELYAVLVIPLAFFIGALQNSKLLVRIPVYTIIFVLTVINIMQAWQLNVEILDGYRMTREYYFRVFLKTSVTEEDKKYLLVERPSSVLETFTNEEDFNRNVVQHFDFEKPVAGEEQHYDTTYAYTGSMSFRMDGTREYSPTLRKEYREISESAYGWVRARVWVYPTADPIDNEAILVIAFRHKGKYYKYKDFSMNADSVKLQLNQWNLITADYFTPELLSRTDKLDVYVWYRGKENIWIDDLKIEFFEPKN
ncbi:MAG: glycosyltransferase family 39 protein [Bacteroidales bacterium]|nr:glycosyltransferase family 39 protein [Bacteroidales bacterium]